VVFSARGAAGGEVVSFWVGGTGTAMGPTADVPCVDPLSASVSVTLKKTWNTYAISLGGATYASGVLTGFGFTVATSNQPVGKRAGATSFYVDDIHWQM
jgi:hypothetical protein